MDAGERAHAAAAPGRNGRFALGFGLAVALLAPAWFAVFVLGQLCNLGEAQPDGGDQCAADTAASAPRAWVCVGVLALALVSAVLLRTRTRRRTAGAWLPALSLTFQVVVLLPIAYLYAAWWLQGIAARLTAAFASKQRWS